MKHDTAGRVVRSGGHHKATAVALLVSLLASLLLAVGAAPANATFAGRNGLVLFNRGGDLYTANASGGAVRRLTTVGGISGAKWSPDGTRIAYRWKGAIWVRDHATGKTARVAQAVKGAPQWSPNGRRLAFLKELPGAPCGEQAVYTVPASGGTPRKDYDPGSDNCPHGTDVLSLGTYEPEGQSALLTLCYGWNDEWCSLQEIRLDGTNHFREITSVLCTMESEFLGACDFNLHLSDGRVDPTGARLLFTGRGGYDGLVGTLPGSVPSPGTNRDERLYVVARDGSGLQRVSTAKAAVNPTWAPDGRSVLFTSTVDGVPTLMRVTELTATAVPAPFLRNASQPDWQPVR